MATKQTKTVSSKSKIGKVAKTPAKRPSKKTPPAKPAVRVLRPAHAKAPAPKARPARHATPTAKPVKQPPVKAPVAHATIDQKPLDRIRILLMRLRDRLSGQIHAQSNDSLKYVDDASSEDRTDDFDRELALNLVSAEHDVLFEVNSALRRIDDEIYGMCDGCNQPIEKTRLNALPFTRMCIKCQSEHERGRKRFRPFGETISQFNEPSGEAEEAEAEEHE